MRPAGATARRPVLSQGVGIARLSARPVSIVCAAADPVAPAASASALPTAPAEGQLLELNQHNFCEYLAAQGDTLVVVDFFTDWCGPCKVIYPELVKLSKERPEIRIVKFNCNKSNKELGVKLGIKVAPTFHLYRNSTKVAEMTGAKVETLVSLIDNALTPSG